MEQFGKRRDKVARNQRTVGRIRSKGKSNPNTNFHSADTKFNPLPSKRIHISLSPKAATLHCKNCRRSLSFKKEGGEAGREERCSQWYFKSSNDNIKIMLKAEDYY